MLLKSCKGRRDGKHEIKKIYHPGIAGACTEQTGVDFLRLIFANPTRASHGFHVFGRGRAAIQRVVLLAWGPDVSWCSVPCSTEGFTSPSSHFSAPLNFPLHFLSLLHLFISMSITVFTPLSVLASVIPACSAHPFPHVLLNTQRTS